MQIKREPISDPTVAKLQDAIADALHNWTLDQDHGSDPVQTVQAIPQVDEGTVLRVGSRRFAVQLWEIV